MLNKLQESQKPLQKVIHIKEKYISLELGQKIIDDLGLQEENF